MENLMVTIVVPAYNHADYIADCVKSVLEQDYSPVELIVINDGSTDKTDEVIRELLSKGPSAFQYISKENEGLIRTLNLGLEKANGKYFCELASDDMLLPGSIGKRVKFLEENPDIDAVFADGYLLEGNVRTDTLVSHGKTRYISSRHTVSDLIRGTARIFFPSGMFRKTILTKLGGFDRDFRYSEDVSMWYKLAKNSNIGYLDEPVMYYRKHVSNTSSSAPFRIASRREKILALEKLLADEKDSLAVLIKKYLYKEYLKLIRLSIRHSLGKNDLSGIYKKAVRMYPFALKIRYYMILSKLKNPARGNEKI